MEKKRSFRKSPGYPYYSLREVVAFLEVVDELGGEQVLDETLLEKLNIKHRYTRSFSYKISSAKQFGLLQQKGETVSLTESARQLIYPISAEAREDLLKSIVQTPPLYAKLVDRFKGRKLPPVEILGNILLREYSIVKGVKGIAAKAFADSLQYAGMISEDLVLKVEIPEEEAILDTPTVGATAPPPRPKLAEAQVAQPLTSPENQLASEEFSIHEIRLASGAKARFQIPDRKITQTDVERMKKLLDILLIEEE